MLIAATFIMDCESDLKTEAKPGTGPPIILATQEVEIRSITVRSQPR
jgi:hypothetical protein